MGKGSRRNEFRKNLKTVLNQEAIVQDLTPVVTLEIRNLDALTTTVEVLEAVQRQAGAINPSNRGEQPEAEEGFRINFYKLCESASETTENQDRLDEL